MSATSPICVHVHPNCPTHRRAEYTVKHTQANRVVSRPMCGHCLTRTLSLASPGETFVVTVLS